MASVSSAYPVRFSVDYPDRDLDRVSSLLRIFWAIPILILLSTVSGGVTTRTAANGEVTSTAAAGGLLIAGPALMILFRQKYPRWWFDWNVEFSRFGARVAAYVLLMDDHYPSTDEQQSVHLDYDYPAMPQGLNRWLPLIKWLLALPHYFVLIFLWIGALIAVIVAWVAILINGRYPRGIFDYVESVMRWSYRVGGYAFVLNTDQYPPFSLAA